MEQQEQLLALAEAPPGRAAQLYARFSPLVTGHLSCNSATSSSSAPLVLLQSAFGARLETRVRVGLCAAPTTKKQPTPQEEKATAALAAKLAQRVIRSYAAVAAGASDAADKKRSA